MTPLVPGQVPDWRPGAVYWAPLADGREVTIYPLLHGAARLCVGPMADEHGYDIAYRYENIDKALEAARDWNSEEQEHPRGYEQIEFKPGPDTAQIHSTALSGGNPIELTDRVRRSFNVQEERSSKHPGLAVYKLNGLTEDGRYASIVAERRDGDRVGVEGAPLARIVEVTLSDAPGRSWTDAGDKLRTLNARNR